MPSDERPKALRAFHDVDVGTDFGGFEYTLSEELVRRHLEATRQEPYPSGDGERFAPVSLLASDGIRLAETQFDIAESVHAGQRLDVVNLPIVGTTVTVSGRLVEKFERKGRYYSVVETVSRDDRGRVLVRGRMVGVLQYRPGGSA